MSVELRVSEREISIDEELWDILCKASGEDSSKKPPEELLDWYLSEGGFDGKSISGMSRENEDNAVNNALYKGLCTVARSRSLMKQSEGPWGKKYRNKSLLGQIKDRIFIFFHHLALLCTFACVPIFVLFIILKLIGVVSWTIWTCLIPLGVGMLAAGLIVVMSLFVIRAFCDAG